MTTYANTTSTVHHDSDICGLCGLPGADKVPHTIRWPDEADPGTPFVHRICEAKEFARASALCTSRVRDAFLGNC